MARVLKGPHSFTCSPLKLNIQIEQQLMRCAGPATVRMVSSNGPPLPMPMQVPPGHMVQQIIDENGILTNVILSSQPPGIMAPPLMVGYYVSVHLVYFGSGIPR